MSRVLFKFLLLAGLITGSNACSKQTGTVETASISDYYPLVIGKFAVYQLDSLLYVNFGQSKEIHRNLIMDLVDAEMNDNSGRHSFRIRRLIQSKTDTSQWLDHATYLVTPLDKSLELIENNLRIIKLQLPINDMISWNGNRYLPEDIFPEYGFNSTAHSNWGSWEYNYENVNTPAMVNGHLYDSTITVTSAVNDSTGFPPTNSNAPVFKTVWEEKYAKGVGLISRKINLEEFQPRTSTYPNGYFSGFALVQTLIRHN